MAFYDEALATAADLIAEFGRPIELVTGTTTSGPSYNPIVEDTIVTVTGVQSSWSAMERDGSQILSTDAKYLFPADAPIENDMTIKDEGRTLAIVNVWPIKPGDTLIYQIAQVRG